MLSKFTQPIRSRAGTCKALFLIKKLSGGREGIWDLGSFSGTQKSQFFSSLPLRSSLPGSAVPGHTHLPTCASCHGRFFFASCSSHVFACNPLGGYYRAWTELSLGGLLTQSQRSCPSLPFSVNLDKTLESPHLLQSVFPVALTEVK